MRGARDGLRLLAAAGITAALVGLPGCVTVRGDSVPSWVPRSLVPSATQRPVPQPASNPAPAPKGTRAAYFVKNGRIVRVARGGKVSATSAKEAISLVLAGPSSAERAAGLSSAIPKGTGIRDAAPDFEGNVRLDLTREFGTGGSTVSVKLRLAQIVAAASQLPNVKGVIVRIGGKPVERFGVERYDLIRPLTRADFAEVLPPE